MLVYSATTAKAYKTYHTTEAMTTSQKEQFHRAFKKYVIEEFKKKEKLVSYKFDGNKKLLSRNVFSVTVYSFYHSANLKNLAMYKKMPNWHYFNTGKDVETICKKTITLIKAAGYKAEYKDSGTILMWKVRK